MAKSENFSRENLTGNYDKREGNFKCTFPTRKIRLDYAFHENLLQLNRPLQEIIRDELESIWPTIDDVVVNAGIEIQVVIKSQAYIVLVY